MALDSEPVEDAAHVDILACSHVEERQIHRGAARVAGFCHDVLLLEKAALVHLGIEIRAHGDVRDIGCPAHEMVHGALRTVGIIDLEAVSQSLALLADGAKAVRRFTGHHDYRCMVSVDPFADEVIGAVIAHFQYDVRNNLPNFYEIAGVHRRTGFLAAPGKQGQDGCQQDKSFHLVDFGWPR